MRKIEITGSWKTIGGVVRALNRQIRKLTNYTGDFFNAKWYESHADKYGEVFDSAEDWAINVCMNADGIYNYGYAAVLETL